MSQQQNHDFELIYNNLIKQFNGRQIISLTEAIEILGYSSSSTHSMLCRGAFPVPTVLIGSKHGVRTLDLARYISSRTPYTAPPPPPVIPSRRRGRPAGTSIKEQYAKRKLAAQQAEAEQATADVAPEAVEGDAK